MKGNSPAFPHIVGGYNMGPSTDRYDGGLTKREYFAGLALQGLLSNPETPKQATHQYGEMTTEGGYKVVCTTAINLADELLKQLK